MPPCGFDGIYTVLDSANVQSDWIKGHDVYFKIEGRIDGVPEKAEWAKQPCYADHA